MSFCTHCFTFTYDLYTIDTEPGQYCVTCVEVVYQKALIQILQRNGSVLVGPGVCCDCGQYCSTRWNTCGSGEYLACTSDAMARLFLVEMLEQSGKSSFQFESEMI